MLTIEQLYVLVFLISSAAIGLANWPHRWHSTGLLCGAIALSLSMVLGWQVAIVSGSWFALGQRLDYLISELQVHHSLLYLPLQGIALTLQMLTDFLAVTAYGAFPGLSINLGVCLVFLALYLVLKTTILLLDWLIYWLSNGHRSRKADRKPPTLAGKTGFLHIATTSLLLLLTPLLAALPYLIAIHPALNFFNTLFWPGAWIMLLELHRWRSGNAVYARGCHPHIIARRSAAGTQNWLDRLQRQLCKVIGGEPQ